MSWMLILVALMAAAAVVLVMVGSRGALREVEIDDRSYQDPLPTPLRLMWPLVTVATRFVAPRMKTAQFEQTHKRLQAAGQDYLLTAEEFYGLKVVSAIVAFLMLCLCLLMLGKLSLGNALSALIIGGLVGWLYPQLSLIHI